MLKNRGWHPRGRPRAEHFEISAYAGPRAGPRGCAGARDFEGLKKQGAGPRARAGTRDIRISEKNELTLDIIVLWINFQILI